jgi:hypothetical protein
MPQAALIGGPGVEAIRRLAHCALALRPGDGRSYRDRHRLANLVLHRKNVGEVAVVVLGPDVVTGLGLDQLRGDADALTGFAQAAFKHVGTPNSRPTWRISTARPL